MSSASSNSTTTAPPEPPPTHTHAAAQSDKRSRLRKKTEPRRPLYVKFLVSDGTAGAIIGKGGATIATLARQTNARIEVSSNKIGGELGTKRIVKVSGAPISCAHVGASIAGIISNRPASTGVRIGFLTCHKNALRIIGRGGATLKWIRKSTLADVMVSSGKTADSKGDRLVSIFGPPNAVVQGVGLVIDKLVDSRVREFMIKILLPGARCGGVIGKQGRTRGRIAAETGTRISVSRPSEFFPNIDPPLRTVVVCGGIVACYRAVAEVIAAAAGAKGTLPSLTVAIPSDTAGTVMGKGAANIRRARLVSGIHRMFFMDTQDKPFFFAERVVSIIPHADDPMALESITRAVGQVMDRMYFGARCTYVNRTASYAKEYSSSTASPTHGAGTAGGGPG